MSSTLIFFILQLFAYNTNLLSKECSDKEFKCKTGHSNLRCFSNDRKCDGNEDCEDGSDETSYAGCTGKFTPTSFHVRNVVCHYKIYLLIFLSCHYSECYCKRASKDTGSDGVVCRHENEYKKSGYCKSDEWCTGPSIIEEATTKERLCSKGKCQIKIGIKRLGIRQYAFASVSC